MNVLNVLNFYYNSSIYCQLEKSFINPIEANSVRISINLILFSIIICYDYSFYDVLSLADCLITDYSSCVFEFSLLRRPGFMFATDLEKYDRGFYFKMDELPYPYAASETELISNIENFENDSYQSNLDMFFEKIGNLENGNACEHLLEWMNNH